MAVMATQWMTLSKSVDGADPEVWNILQDGEALRFQTPEGGIHRIANDEPLKVLRSLVELDPTINTLRELEDVVIGCVGEVRDVLPLWLRPLDEVVQGGRRNEELEDSIEESLWWIPTLAHHLSVNGEVWAVIASNASPYESSPRDLFAVPVAGDDLPLWFKEEWASVGFIEMGSMTSGLDTSVLGLLTDRVVSWVDRLDEQPTCVWIGPLTAPEEHFKAWLEGNWLARQLRETWNIPPGEDDFVAWGFLKLAQQGGGSIDLAGALSDDTGDLGIGLTPTSRWTFTSSLPSTTIVEALGTLTDRRPGDPAT